MSKAGADSMQCDKDVPDRISILCDDIILCILSLLSVKEAASTSVLSKRWKYLWIASLTRMVFNKDAFPNMDDIAFEKMIDGIIHRFPKGMRLEEFYVHFKLWQHPESRTNEWLDFAFSSATRVELELVSRLPPAYSVPIKLFHENRFSALRELFLISIGVGSQVFEAIMNTCASLECLVVFDDDQLITAKCNVPHLKLKRLAMDCRFLESLEINAPNLVLFSFWYSSHKMTRISIVGAQSLVSLNITGARGDVVFGQFFAYISQLRCLTLDSSAVLETIRVYGKVPSLRNLTTLSLVDSFGNPYSAAIYMLDASPLLQRFELHLSDGFFDNGQHGMVSMSRHNNLKKIVLSGFWFQDIRFVSFIVGHTSVLESIEVTTKKMIYYKVNRDGSYRKSFLEAQNDSEYFELRSSLLSTIPSYISVRLFDE